MWKMLCFVLIASAAFVTAAENEVKKDTSALVWNQTNQFDGWKQLRNIKCEVKDGLLVLTDIHRYREEWKQVKGNPQVTVTFDLYDMGIAFCLARLNKQDYIVNW